MFKNRLRTAALAGAVAVATGLSGLSIPAYAQTQDGNFQEQDGSAAQPVSPQNISEAELRTQTDATASYLAGLQGATSLESVIEAYINLGGDGFDPSEGAAKVAFEEAKNEASAQLAISAQNILNARASVGFALEADRQAEADWDAFVAELNAVLGGLNILINDVNAANTHVPTFVILPNLPAVATDATAVDVFKQLVELQITVNEQWDLAGDWNIDIADGEYVNRTHMAALEALKNSLDNDLESVTEAYEVAKASNREAQKSDVLVRQLFLERATAQRDTLRVVEAAFSVAERYIELFQNNELVGDSTLRTEYREVLFDIFNGLQMNLNWLEEADDAAVAGFLVWETDLLANDDEKQYFIEKVEFATATYAKIFINGWVWQEALERVELLDQNIIDDRNQAEADREAAEKAAAEAKELEEARIKALDDIAKALEDKNNTPAPTPPAEKPAGSSSDNAGLFGLIAAIGGIAALIAAAFPFISSFLR
ncbi:S-layer protein PS2 [Corynebacterium sp. A21]|uniref:S-layer protein PS2 n=1 Tax=Corynebacterium sp. A21 TaxID=3457318 RepID=UPI003FD019C2